jgi:peptidylprolyl isomerase
MREFVTLALMVLAGPAVATGLEIDIAGADGPKGTVRIDLFEDVAPQHAARIAALAEQGAYDGVVFHRVIDGFMAQTGDVQYGDAGADGFDMRRAGTGGSDMGNLPAEFSDRDFARGVVGMARSRDPDSANSQFFIMFAPAPHLNGQYTVVGEVTEGMAAVDAIKRGQGRNGAVAGEPDRMVTVAVTE